MIEKNVFRLRSKPEEPVRASKREQIRIYGGESLLTLAEQVLSQGGDPEEGRFDRDYGFRDEDDGICFAFEVEESEADFKYRHDKWKERIALWNAWYKENETQILRFLAEKEEKEAKKGALRIEREKAQLEKRLKTLEKLKKQFQR